jgi:hypothetical protein
MSEDDRPGLERVGEHTFLARLSQGGEIVEIVLRLDAATLAAVAPDGTDERRVAQETMTFLTEHQRADDLPASLDLADVAAAYDDWVDVMRTRLQGDSEAAK